MEPLQIYERVKSRFGDRVLEVAAGKPDPFIVVDPAAIVEIGRYMKDDAELAMDCLSNESGVDYKDRIEVVYHLFSYKFRHTAVLKIKLPRENPSVETLENVWKSANWMEREIFDLLGVTFTGHSDLRRILMPEDWIGHPLRKDFVEPMEYHGISTVRESPIIRLDEKEMSTLRTEEMTLNMGPQHPSTHGVLRFVVRADGEVMREAIPDVGYLHRSIEKIAEKVGYHGFMPYTDRVDYVCAMFTNQGWGMACEKLAHIEVPKRGEYCRVIAAEFNRIASHLLSVGTMGMDIGAMTPFTHAIREREMINDLIEELCGARLTFNYMRIGGVAWDLPPGWREKAIAYLDHLGPIIDEFNSLLSFNKIYIERLANIGIITAEEAVNYNLVGPNLRGCGVRWDIRKDVPYSVYPDFDFEVPIGAGKWGTLGDSMDRYMVRIYEMKESVKILRQALEKIPPGSVLAKVPRNFKPPAGECQIRVESARGDMGWYVVSDGTGYPWRVHVRTGSFAAMGITQKLSQGLMIADLVTLIASLDVIAPEIDR